jgi:Ca2+-binding RTX toxin-like protein
MASGTALRDVIRSLGGDDIVNGLSGNDFINGGTGFDTLSGNAGFDSIFGGSGNDTLNGDADDDQLFGESGKDTMNGGSQNDRLDGGTQDNILNGDTGNDTLLGAGGADTMNGGAGNDELRGGREFDTMTGGADHDTFVIINGDFGTLDPMIGFGHRDIITDFQVGQDKIDLNFLDAKAGVENDQAFSFIGTAKFSAEGQVRQITEGDHTVIQANNVGEAGADFEIQLTGFVNLGSNDFIL